jgi:hypothetical protein
LTIPLVNFLKISFGMREQAMETPLPEAELILDLITPVKALEAALRTPDEMF